MKIIKRGRKTMARMCASLLLEGMACAVWAGNCTYGTTSGDGPEAVYSFTVPSTIALTGTEAPGTVLWTSSTVGGSKLVYTNCPGGAGSAGLVDWWGTTSSSVGGYNVMPTNVAGIGYVISHGAFPSGVKGYPGNPDGPAPANLNNTYQATLRFIKTSAAYFPEASAATDRTGDLVTWYVGTNRLRFANFTVSNTVTFTKSGGGGGGGGGGGRTCRMNPVNVSLGENSTRAFPSIGAKGNIREVPITLFCNAKFSRLTLSFAPSNGAVDNMNGVAKLSPAATARGIGVALLRDQSGTAVNLEQAYPVRLRNDSDGSFANVSYYAAPVSIGTSVSGGSIVTSITATLDYQ